MSKKSVPSRIVIPAHTRSMPAPRKPAAVIAIGVGPAAGPPVMPADGSPLPMRPSAPTPKPAPPRPAPITPSSNPLAGLLRSGGGNSMPPKKSKR